MKTWTWYIFSFIGLAIILSLVFTAGNRVEHAVNLLPAVAISSTSHAPVTEAYRNPLAIFMLQIILIIITAQVCIFFVRKIGQPAVMGEIIAGILLGPSLMGAVLPQFSAFVFPAASLGNLQILSQVGLILFMFVIGMELDLDILKEKASTAVFISYFSIIIPFGLGVVLSYFLYQRYTPANIPFYAFSLFTGIALSITAFPVLARIIRERGLSGTRLGNIAITAAAIGDIAAWCILAFIVAIVKAGSFHSFIYTIVEIGVYVSVMLFVIKPMLAKLAFASTDNAVLKRSVMVFIFIILFLSAYCCEVIGIHALFGAFLAGGIMPRKKDAIKKLIDKIEDVVLALFLPLFFVSTGLRTQVFLLNSPALWGVCIIITLTAVIGKFGGSVVAARIKNESGKDSLSIGALMNTRGLVELVVLNIGYDLGILSPQMFTMMVIMALATTFMTNPLLNLINRKYR